MYDTSTFCFLSQLVEGSTTLLLRVLILGRSRLRVGVLSHGFSIWLRCDLGI